MLNSSKGEEEGNGEMKKANASFDIEVSFLVVPRRPDQKHSKLVG